MTPHINRILCVEDDDDVSLMISSLLGFFGYEVTVAQTLTAAFEKANDERFHLYLLDTWLPGGLGVDLCRKIRETDASTPIVFYSGADFESDRQQAIDAGANAYLIKPMDIDKLLGTIRGLLAA